MIHRFHFLVEEDDSAKITWHDGSTVEDLQHLSLEPLTSGGHQVGKCGRLSLSTSKRKDRLNN